MTSKKFKASVERPSAGRVTSDILVETTVFSMYKLTMAKRRYLRVSLIPIGIVETAGDRQEAQESETKKQAKDRPMRRHDPIASLSLSTGTDSESDS